MKVVFCLDDKPQYLLLLKGAVRSLRAIHGQNAPCLVVYAGDDKRVLNAIEAENIPLARHKPYLHFNNMAPCTHRVMGAFLKLELSLLPELANDDVVLYCDTDVFFNKPLTDLEKIIPPYLGMAREQTAPFFPEHQSFTYTHRGREYTVPMPFPIWTYNSGVVLFNLEQLRKRDYIYNFLDFCWQVSDRIGNFDQSMVNYFFGKRITKLNPMYNCPPYMPDSKKDGIIVHFHGPKPWEIYNLLWDELRVEHFDYFRKRWLDLMNEDELAEIKLMEETQKQERVKKLEAQKLEAEKKEAEKLKNNPK